LRADNREHQHTTKHCERHTANNACELPASRPQQNAPAWVHKNLHKHCSVTYEDDEREAVPLKASRWYGRKRIIETRRSD
jgi:hypothetical protein